MGGGDAREAQHSCLLGEVTAREHGVLRRPSLVDPVLGACHPEAVEFAVERGGVRESQQGGSGDGRVERKVGCGKGVGEGAVEVRCGGGGQRGEEGGPRLGGEGAGGEQGERRVQRPPARGGSEEPGDVGVGVGVEEFGNGGGERVAVAGVGGVGGVGGDDANGACVCREAEYAEHGGVGVGGSGERQRRRQDERRVVAVDPSQLRNPTATPPAGLRHRGFCGFDECARNDQRYDTSISAF